MDKTPGNIRRIVFALTYAAAEDPVFAERVQTLCGCALTRKDPKGSFENCPAEVLMPFWLGLVGDPDAERVMDRVWTGFQNHLADLEKRAAAGASMPPLHRQAKTFATSTAREFAAIAHGIPALNAGQIQERRATCAACPWRDAAQGRCKKCGCFIDVKTAYRTASCPADKWRR